MESQEFTSSFPSSGFLSPDLRDVLLDGVDPQIFQILDQSQGYESVYPKVEDALQNEENTMPLTENFHFPSDVSPQFHPLKASKLLSNEEYEGPYDFDVFIVPNPKSKNPWVYSPFLNKVFMDMNQAFPVEFRVRKRPETPLYVRITPQYAQQQSANEPVCRCINHEHYADPTNKEIPEHVRQHVIRSQNPHAQYLGNSNENERLSIILPLDKPQVGNETTTELFLFVCKSTCSSPGMNRRAVEVIFTLEDHQSQIVGRKCIKVRICSCPKRDKEKEEKEQMNGTGPPKGKKRKVEHPIQSGKVLPMGEDTNMYTIKLNLTGKQNVLKVLDRAEELYLANAYKLRGSPEEDLMRRNVAEIQAEKRRLM
ncbi:cellular tumor antigen p53 [Anthonomus grandis grandis]|uniref:cellular tumor antigen p53 n=1 Tax=Anthonomus grandis grandis TaxID=2921223 RepID=UPI0021650B5F|nr:cellular tumor antigen p53 [Anthonomus grandis grandis]